MLKWIESGNDQSYVYIYVGTPLLSYHILNILSKSMFSSKFIVLILNLFTNLKD